MFKVFENFPSQGSVAARDRLLRQAKGEIVVSLDDDSYPVANDFFARLEPVIQAHPEAAVITFPELHDGNIYAVASKTLDVLGHYVSAYANCGAVMKREFYLQQAGFPKFFVHMYEEPDYALQCYASEAAVWFEPSLLIRHHQSPQQRQPMQRHHQNARNELWSVWMRCPWPQLPVVSLFRVWRQFRYACTEGLSWAIQEPVWWLAAIAGLLKCWRNRKPIPWPVYYAWMRLARNPIFDLAGLEKILWGKGK